MKEMKIITGIAVTTLVALNTLANTNAWRIATIQNNAPFKISFGIGNYDGELPNDALITDFRPSPPSIDVFMPGSKQSIKLKNEGNSVFTVHNKLTATVSNQFTHATQTVRITNRPEDTMVLGTNIFWVLDIREKPPCVLLKQTNTGEIVTIKQEPGDWDRDAPCLSLPN
jgi:hypothetical protein